VKLTIHPQVLSKSSMVEPHLSTLRYLQASVSGSDKRSRPSSCFVQPAILSWRQQTSLLGGASVALCSTHVSDKTYSEPKFSPCYGSGNYGFDYSRSSSPGIINVLQNGSGANPTYSVHKRGSFPRGKVAGA
jgi:hypothetical protein